MILLDGSGSVGDANFLEIKSWVKKVARSMQIEKEHVQIGVVRNIRNQPSVQLQHGGEGGTERLGDCHYYSFLQYNQVMLLGC